MLLRVDIRQAVDNQGEPVDIQSVRVVDSRVVQADIQAVQAVDSQAGQVDIPVVRAADILVVQLGDSHVDRLRLPDIP